MRPGVQVAGIAFVNNVASGAVFDESLLSGTGIELVTRAEGFSSSAVLRRVVAAEPDLVVVSGWFNPAFRDLVNARELAGAHFVMCMDNPWLGTLRQRLGLRRHRRFLERMDSVVVAGERSYQFARRLGFPESSIDTGLYGFDDTFDASSKDGQSKAFAARRTFLYLGRYSPEKGLKQLLQAYARYRSMVSDPWRLLCCGGGAMKESIAAADGVEDAGFVQPSDLPSRFAEAGALVLPSSFEPWGVAIGEGAMAGLPIICTRSCGASVEIVRHLYNGYVYGADSESQLCSALHWMHSHPDRLESMGANSRLMAAPFGASAWAERWDYLAHRLVQSE